MLLQILTLLYIITIVKSYTIVINVMVPLLASSHAKNLTSVINKMETKGCKLILTDTYNNSTYLYFDCPPDY